MQWGRQRSCPEMVTWQLRPVPPQSWGVQWPGTVGASEVPPGGRSVSWHPSHRTSGKWRAPAPALGGIRLGDWAGTVAAPPAVGRRRSCLLLRPHRRLLLPGCPGARRQCQWTEQVKRPRLDRATCPWPYIALSLRKKHAWGATK